MTGWAAVALAQGGNPGEGPGWTRLFLLAGLAAALVLGTLLTIGLVVIHRGHARKPTARAVVAAYVVAALLVVAAAAAGLVTASWAAVAAVIVAGGAGFWIVAARRG